METSEVFFQQAGVISTQQGRGCYVADRPDDQQLSVHRRSALRAIMDRALLEALSLGYDTSVVEAAFREQIKRWRRKRK